MSQRLEDTGIDEYLASLAPDARGVVKEIRKFVQRTVPAAEETIGEQVPAFKLRRTIIYFAANSNGANMNRLHQLGLHVILLNGMTSCIGQTKSANHKQQTLTTDPKLLVGGGCDGWELMFVGMPTHINSVDTPVSISARRGLVPLHWDGQSGEGHPSFFQDCLNRSQRIHTLKAALLGGVALRVSSEV